MRGKDPYSSRRGSSMLFGVLSGLFCGALWGLTFVAPRAVDPFSTIDLTVLRYGLFGGFSILLMLAVSRFRPHGYDRRRLILGLALGGCCYTGYFLAIALAVRYAGTVIPPIIVGTMPVVLALIANWNERSVPWRNLAAPLGLIAAGVGAVNLGTLSDASDVAARTDTLLGVGFSVLSLAIWVGYGLVNGAVMRARNAPDPVGWTCLQGVGALATSLLLVPFTSFFDPAAPAHAATDAQTLNFIAWGVTLGLAASWLATVFWVVASARLPVALTAQLMVTETVFGLISGFVFESRWPTGYETTGILLQIAGVMVATYIFSQSGRTAILPEPVT